MPQVEDIGYAVIVDEDAVPSGSFFGTDICEGGDGTMYVAAVEPNLQNSNVTVIRVWHLNPEMNTILREFRVPAVGSDKFESVSVAYHGQSIGGTAGVHTIGNAPRRRRVVTFFVPNPH